jgi:1,4-dihydroxy-2-naphthoyl-CoA hydrolase
MAIWKSKFSFEDIESRSKNTLSAHLGIRVTEIGDDYVKATMPVNDRTRQPLGLLHGGASVALAESVGSLGARMTLEPGFACVGMEINANHIRSVRQGIVTGIAKPIHRGLSTQIWDVRIYDEDDNIVCVSRLTMAIIKPS